MTCKHHECKMSCLLFTNLMSLRPLCGDEMNRLWGVDYYSSWWLLAWCVIWFVCHTFTYFWYLESNISASIIKIGATNKLNKSPSNTSPWSQRYSAQEKDLSPDIMFAHEHDLSPHVKWAPPTNEILSRIRTLFLGPFRSKVPLGTSFFSIQFVSSRLF